MKFFDIIKGCFTPKTFFSHLTDETLGEPLKYLSIWIGIFTLLYLPIAIIGVFFIQFIPELQEIKPLWIIIGYIGLALFYYAALVCGMFIGSAIVHVILKLFKAKKPFAKTFQIITYSLTPGFIYGILSIPLVFASFIPILGMFVSLLTIPISIGVSVYSIFLRVYGFSKAHNISYLRAAVPDIIGIIVGMLIAIIYVIVIIFIVLQNAI